MDGAPGAPPARLPRLLKKKLLTPDRLRLHDLETGVEGRLLDYVPRLVSRSTGLVRKLEPVYKDLSEPSIPFIFRAEVSNHRFMEKQEDAFITASGKGFSRDSAMLSALGEAVERYSAAAWGDEIIERGRIRDLDGAALDPRRLVLFADHQYDVLKYDPWDDECSLGWARMRALDGGEDVAVPALAVVMAYETRADEPFLFPITSNGLAAGATLPQAILSGAYEVVERDAFLCVWLNRLPCRRIYPLGHPDSNVRALVRAHARRGVALELYEAPTDHDVYVFIGVAVADSSVEGPAAVVGLGADHDPAEAARSALIEACQVRPALRMRLRKDEIHSWRDELVDDPQRVATLEDHDLLYTDPRMLGAFDFLRKSPEHAFDWSTGLRAAPLERVRALVADLRHLGTDLLYADLTVDDVATTGVAVVRVVIPDFQPMHFGYAERRLAAQRLYAVPQRLGFRATPTRAADLNSHPHPLA